VRSEEYRGVELLAQAADVDPEVAPALRIQPGGGRVQEHQARRVDEAERYFQAGPLPARQRLDHAPLKAAELKQAG
jgi:hypothetical protein